MARALLEPEVTESENGDEPKGIPFFPDFALREALTASGYLILLILLSSLTRPSLEPVADPAASGYVPRPEWYFLWLFQSLRYFGGELEIVGTFILPTLGIALLLSVPFLDRREARPRPLLPRTRPIRLWPRAVGAAAVAGIATLTILGVLSAAPIAQHGPELTEAQAAGKAVFEKMGCVSCHSLSGQGGTRGPDLTDFGARSDAEQRVLLHFTGVSRDAESLMPGYQLTQDELRWLAAYLLSLRKG